MKKNKDNLRGSWDNIKWNNIHIIRISKGERKQGEKAYLKKWMKIFP